MDIGARIRTERKAAKLSQEQLARRSDVPLNRVARIETGVVVDPHLSTITKIAGGLGVPVSEILGERVDPKAEAPSSRGKGDEERRGDWVVDSLDRTVSYWGWQVEENPDPKSSFAIAVACLDIARNFLRFDLPGDTLKDRVPEHEVADRVRWVERLFNLSQKAQQNYATSPEADAVEVAELDERRKPILHVIEGGAA